MPVFADTEDFYAVMQRMADALAQDEPAVQSFKRANMTVRFRSTSPVAEMVLDGRHNPVRVLFGRQPLRADLDITLTSDLLHELLLGRRRIRDAFAAGEIKVTGNIFRALQLAEPLRHVEAIYPRVLHEMGREV
ncbi:MAG: SCP2 sterol-binding domain-containing protein [Caldilineales bacterium]|nr:SCP2 sterol-binding domain-containing protein [Caldilineales bacterium]MDW8316943.1 SCP2 sterol-binding domain-containing protein [Anaerolineae bacterium]